MLPALTTDVLVHTCDLGRAARLDPALDAELVGRTELYDMHRDGGFVGLAARVRGDTDAVTELIARDGRNHQWTPAPIG